MRHVTTLEPPSAEKRVRSCGIRGSAETLPSREIGFRTVGHMAALEPSPVGRQGPEPWDTWWYQSPPQLGGGVQNHGTHGSMFCSLPWTYAWMRRYPVCMVPTLSVQVATKPLPVASKLARGKSDFRILRVKLTDCFMLAGITSWDRVGRPSRS
jgi:hypothetical protein